MTCAERGADLTLAENRIVQIRITGYESSSSGSFCADSKMLTASSALKPARFNHRLLLLLLEEDPCLLPFFSGGGGRAWPGMPGEPGSCSDATSSALSSPIGKMRDLREDDRRSAAGGGGSRGGVGLVESPVRIETELLRSLSDCLAELKMRKSLIENPHVLGNFCLPRPAKSWEFRPPAVSSVGRD